MTPSHGAQRFCAFADASCPSGQRWDRTAGDGLSRQCVDSSLVVTPQPNGSSCTAGSQCTSTFCVDGFCCKTDCSGDACSACNVAGSEGTCTAVPNGQPPAASHPKCGPDDKSTCQLDGTCDGKGACRLYQNTTQCASSSCDATANTTVDPGFCDGAGTCVKPNARTCAPYVCDGSAQTCFASCTGAGQCSGTNSCVNNSCGPKANGANCTADDECANKHCVKGVCCDGACDGTCQGCNVGVNRGTCTSVPAGQPDPQGGCKPGSGADVFCSPGGCNGSGACAVAPATTVCRPASCDTTANEETELAYCNGATCPLIAKKPCAPYTCGSTACGGTCNGDSQCTSTYYCASPNCVPRLAGGTSCTANDQCLTGICTPQVCLCGQSGCASCSPTSCTTNAKVCCDAVNLPPGGSGSWCMRCFANGHLAGTVEGCCI